MGIENINNLSVENTERLLNRYSYCNIEIPGRPIIFECDAVSPEEADALFKDRFGKDPKGESHISRGSINA